MNKNKPKYPKKMPEIENINLSERIKKTIKQQNEQNETKKKQI